MNMEKIFFKTFLKNFEELSFEVKFWDDEVIKVGKNESLFKLHLKEPIPKKALLTSTSLAFGEAYMDGNIEIDGDLFTVFDELLKCIDKFSTDFKSLPKIFKNSTSEKHQKEEVSYHYDIGNDFYKLWLDDTMSYSCGYFKNPTDTLYDAQMNKVHHLLKKLNLKEGLTLLDIGCGWGGLLIEAAKLYKVKGLGITLSQEQHDEFKRRIKEEGLEDYLDVKIMDYRDLKKSKLSFDRIVSVGMLEHVGRENYNLFFENVNSVLNKGGVFVLHYISGLKESQGDAWIKKYIFPGGVIPTLREIISLSAEYKFYTIDVESLRLHYKNTLLHWAKNFDNNIDKVRKMHDSNGRVFDERFIRMWRMYLYCCVASFNNGVIDLHQIVFVKDTNNNLPMTREYMYR
ncbi:class I SAM-dependent methyltransferase [Clostridium tertium]|uniref:class I SAM-dependent methyltransferase n=1 Tax=Clostridium tertium TaxID=1559 RepID=UPI001AE81843|nr:class I SAM-dependent methyltransferase [Clostridium tertium]MBP1867920.1 cyclopropane-fatty-acyl-phospholipid synthase [Clostridium tertium]